MTKRRPQSTLLPRLHELAMLVLIALVAPILAVSPSSVARADTAEPAKLVAADAAAEDYFGYSVSVSGDAALIGAPFTDDVGQDSGSAYVLRFDGSAWKLEQKLTASDPSALDTFGAAVSIDGDVALVGSRDDDHGGLAGGSAYIFRDNGLEWVEEQKLTASDAASFDVFGNAVSLSGNVALVGAHLDDDSGSGSGSAYVFRHDGSGWIEEQKLVAADAAADDSFGYALSIHGNVALVGARYDDDSGANAGAAYVFRHDGSTWVEEQKLVAGDGTAGDFFGAALSIHGDLALIGATGDDQRGDGAGAAYVFRFDGSSWSEEQKLTASDGRGGDEFAFSVAVGPGTAAIGAIHGRTDEIDSGATYTYWFDGGVWVEEQKLVAGDAAQFDFHGYSVALDHDRIVIGSVLDDDGGEDSGSAYVASIAGCRAGRVNAGNGPVDDVLTVNGTCGGQRRTVTLPVSTPIEVTMAPPVHGPATARFVLYAWLRAPDDTTHSPQPYGLGTMCLPTFLTVGVPKPDVTWNNIGHTGLLGAADYPSSPAPSTILSLAAGSPREATVTLQGFIEDDGSAAHGPASITNAVVLEIVR